MNIKSTEKHYGIIEISIHTVKGRGGITCHYVPYINFTNLMTNSLDQGTIYWINEFPSNNGFSNTIGTA